MMNRPPGRGHGLWRVCASGAGDCPLLDRIGAQATADRPVWGEEVVR